MQSWCNSDRNRPKPRASWLCRRSLLSVDSRATSRGKGCITTRLVMSASPPQTVFGNPSTNARHLWQSQEVHCVGGLFPV